MLSEDDIYRGKVPSALPIIAESVAPASSTSSLTSSGSFIAGRLGALAAVLENAITRWARRRSSSASTSSSSSSSSASFHSSIYTPSRHRHSRRRKRPTSFANMRSTHSEREVAARLRVRQEIRCVDRGFTLYLPPGLNPEITMTRLSESLDRPQQSVSLSDVLNRLEAALKKASRAKKGKGKQRQFSLGTPPLFPHHDYMSNGVLKRPASFGDLSSALLSSVQGKQKEFSSGNRKPNESAPGGSLELNRAPKAWWLDVASPTWDDLQAIGKVGTFVSSACHADLMSSSYIFILLHLRIFSNKIRAKKWSSFQDWVIILSRLELYRMQPSRSRVMMFTRLTTVL